jgi:hypothetical protein
MCVLSAHVRKKLQSVGGVGAGQRKTGRVPVAASHGFAWANDTRLAAVSDVHHKILGLRKTIFSAEEAEQQDRLAVQQAVAMDGIRKALTQ